jgi:hypothetical protein
MNRNEMLARGLAILAPRAVGNPSLHEGWLCIGTPPPSSFTAEELAELRRCGWNSGHEDDVHWWDFRIEEK